MKIQIAEDKFLETSPNGLDPTLTDIYVYVKRGEGFDGIYTKLAISVKNELVDKKIEEIKKLEG